jgi:hypothetical protein
MCVSTGNRYLDIGLSVAVGAATGGLGAVGGLATTTGASVLGTVAPSLLAPVAVGGLSSAAIGAIGGAVIGLGTGVLGAMLTPQQPTYQAPQQTAQVQQLQQFNSQQIATTGSGGRQASASLAEAIKRSKQRKLSQEDVGDLSIDTSSFAPTGLQFA